MDNLSASGVSSQTADVVSIYALRKSLDIQQSTMTQLLQALPQPSYNNPPNLGNRIDTRA